MRIFVAPVVHTGHHGTAARGGYQKDDAGMCLYNGANVADIGGRAEPAGWHRDALPAGYETPH